MAYGDGSTAIRNRAMRDYIEPALKSGAGKIIIPIKPLMRSMEADGFPANQPRAFCKSLQSRRFLRDLCDKGVRLDRVDGPPSGTGSSVTLHFRVAENPVDQEEKPRNETDDEMIDRIVDGMSGLFARGIAAQGGATALIRRLRYEDD